MKLSVINEPIVKWPVDFEIETEDGLVSASFTAKFKIIEDEKIELYQASGDTALIDKVLMGWEGIEDEEGNELPFNADNLKAMTKYAHRRVQIIIAFYDCFANCARKNSKG